MPRLQWDIFCRVIDNFGDIGVCWRLAAALAQRGQAVRLWVDDATALAWMAPAGCSGVEMRNWQPDTPMPEDTQPGDVVIEAFGCEVNHAWIAMNSVASSADPACSKPRKTLESQSMQPMWINLEYLSAEAYVARSHGLSSPVMSGAAKGFSKWFFYPGFTDGTGGLIREGEAITTAINLNNSTQHLSLFCYEPQALEDLLQQLADAPKSSVLIALPGRGEHALRAAINRKNDVFPMWNLREALSIQEQIYLSQPQYDALLGSCDVNFVRGEDSLVRAIWAGRAFVWQIYPQADHAHAAKLEAFLDWLQAPQDLREFHRIWNGLQTGALPRLRPEAWGECTLVARKRLTRQRDLVSQLLDFVQEKRSLPV